MRYWNKRSQFLRKVFRVTLISGIIVFIGATILYFISPKPFQNIVYKQFLGRKFLLSFYNVLVTQPFEPHKSPLEKYYLEIDPKIEAQIQNEPITFGKQWQNVFLTTEEERNIPVRLKTRGHKYSGFHWGGYKKSLWVKTKAGHFIDNWKRVTFTNFKQPVYFIDALAYNMAKDFNLLGPRHRFVNLFINKEYRGVFHLMENMDKHYVQNEERTSGDLYVLDEYEDLKNAFLTPKYWTKKSANRKAPKKNNKNIVQAIECIKDLACDLNSIFDIDAFLRHKVLFELLGTDHADNYHNQRWFMEPSKGLFEPVVWDILVFDVIKDFNQSNNYLEQRLMRDPKIREQKLQIQEELLTKSITEEYLEKHVNDLFQRLDYSMSTDRYLGNLFPFSYKEWKNKVDEIRVGLKRRRKELLGLNLKNSNTQLTSRLGGDYILSSNYEGTLTIINIKSKSKSLKINNKQVPFPSLTKPLTVGADWETKDGIYETRMGQVPNTKVIKKSQVTKIKVKELLSITVLDPMNNKEITLTPTISNIDLKEFAVTKNIETKAHEVITWGPGIIILKEDFHLKKDQSLIVKPGTNILFNKDVSFYSEGKVTLIGEKESPIIIRPFKESEPFGTFSVFGPYSKGSEFKYIQIHGGRDSRFKGIFFSGMLNCYHTACTVSDSYFGKNYGDDALNIKSSNEGEVYNNLFFKTAFDAIDLDFTSINVYNNIIYKTGNDGVDLGTGHATVYENIIYGAGDKGVSAGERSHPIIYNNYIIGAKLGIAAKDKSEFFAFNNYFIKNETMFSAYQKKAAFGGSHPIVFNNYFYGNKTFLEKDPQSDVELIENKKIKDFVPVPSGITALTIEKIKPEGFRLDYTKEVFPSLESRFYEFKANVNWDHFQKLLIENNDEI
jgi:hypothetical protein